MNQINVQDEITDSDRATLKKELIKNLAAEGLKGEVAAVKGLDLQDSKLVIEETLHVRRHQQF